MEGVLEVYTFFQTFNGWKPKKHIYIQVVITTFSKINDFLVPVQCISETIGLTKTKKPESQQQIG